MKNVSKPLPAGFITRFQESAQVSTAAEVLAAKTKTSVQREQPDEGRAIPLAGTKTQTEQGREVGDPDPSSTSHHVFPRT
jgi:hypothetical protein